METSCNMLLKIFDDNVFITKVFPKTYIDSVVTMICGRGHLKKIYAFMAKVKLIKTCPSNVTFNYSFNKYDIYMTMLNSNTCI